MTDNKKIFEDATKHILDTVDEFGMGAAARDFALMLRSRLVMPTVRMEMVPSFHQMNFYPSQGFCEPVTLTWVDKMGPDWEIMYISSSEWAYGPHFFAWHRPTRRRLDLTYDQYAVRGIMVPYALGRPVEMDRRRTRLLKKFLAVTNCAGRDA